MNGMMFSFSGFEFASMVVLKIKLIPMLVRATPSASSMPPRSLSLHLINCRHGEGGSVETRDVGVIIDVNSIEAGEMKGDSSHQLRVTRSWVVETAWATTTVTAMAKRLEAVMVFVQPHGEWMQWGKQKIAAVTPKGVKRGKQRHRG